MSEVLKSTARPTGFHSSLPTIAVVGSPNAGKTTLFNWISGSNAKAVNYPGATVDYTIGNSLKNYGEALRVLDTPGTYSLFPKTPEERVTEKLLFSSRDDLKPTSLIVVVDATQFQRQCTLVRQLKSSGWPVVVALTMSDVIAAEGIQLDVQKLSHLLEAPVVRIDGRLGGGVFELVDKARKQVIANKAPSIQKISRWTSEDFQSELKFLNEAYASCFSSPLSKNQSSNRTKQIDRFLLHPIGGGFIFVATMILLFSSIFWAAAPAMDIIDSFFGALANKASAIAPDALWADFLGNGLIAGFGSFLVFVPQIFILFFGLTILEDSGYLARAATLVDRPLSLIGLNGRSFVPLLSGHACAVPAMMAARTIPNKKERWLTLFILPLMTCSARLPVYALLLSFLFASAFESGLWLTTIYFGTFLLGSIATAVASRFVPNLEKSFFMLELPSYRIPSLLTSLRTALSKTRAFIFRAGPVILVLSIVIWAGVTFPNHNIEDEAERLQSSYAAQAGQFIQPAMKPLGLDWKSGVGIITSIAAREVFVSTMALMYNVSNEDEDQLQASLISAMKKSKHADGSAVFTVASVAGLIIFYMIALQCIATVSIAHREANSWIFAIGQLIGYNVFAYIAAFLTHTLLM